MPTGAKNAILKSMKSMATKCRTEAITEEDVLQAAVENVAGNHSLSNAVSNYTSLEGKRIGFGLFSASGIKNTEIIGYYFGSVVSKSRMMFSKKDGLLDWVGMESVYQKIT